MPERTEPCVGPWGKGAPSKPACVSSRRVARLSYGATRGSKCSPTSSSGRATVECGLPFDSTDWRSSMIADEGLRTAQPLRRFPKERQRRSLPTLVAVVGHRYRALGPPLHPGPRTSPKVHAQCGVTAKSGMLFRRNSWPANRSLIGSAGPLPEDPTSPLPARLGNERPSTMPRRPLLHCGLRLAVKPVYTCGPGIHAGLCRRANRAEGDQADDALDHRLRSPDRRFRRRRRGIRANGTYCRKRGPQLTCASAPTSARRRRPPRQTVLAGTGRGEGLAFRVCHGPFWSSR